jgi:hypothetical protein
MVGFAYVLQCVKSIRDSRNDSAVHDSVMPDWQNHLQQNHSCGTNHPAGE